MSQLNIRTWMTSVPPTIGPKDSVRRARMLLRTTKASELLVIDNGKLVGMLNERDIWRYCPTSTMMMEDHQVDELLDRFRVGAVMALHPPMVTPDAQLSEAARLFAESGRTGIPVVEDGAPVGFLSEATFMQAAGMLLSADQEEATKK